ncbi:hypothetical protein AMECASPLE_002411 [Ameca splendens]|uniref:Uncharacterized protein n=1 Tax=Ameca splendens TaxID=208324 RepID=A0ABV0Y9A8_9TELE
MLSSLDYYDNGGANGGAGVSSSLSGGLLFSSTEAPAPGSYGSYYQNEGSYTAQAANKMPKKKPPVLKGGKANIPGPPRGPAGPPGGYLLNVSAGQGSYNQYGQVKKSFNQNQGGMGGYSYSTAYPSQVTGGTVPGGNQEYSYEGFSHQSSYSAQGGVNQGFGSNHTPYHSPGFGRGDGNMNYQYR